MSGRGGLPLWLKLAYSAFMAVWVPVTWIHKGPTNFLWLCDVGNFLLLAAIWSESRLVFSWQACGLLLVEIGFVVDLGGRLVLGFHPIGGTEFMLDDSTPLGIRALSLFHVALLPVLILGVARLGYDRRAFWLQTATAWIVLAASFFFFEEKNLNFVRAPFNRPQEWVSEEALFAACLVLYPIILYLPTHLVLVRWRGRR